MIRTIPLIFALLAATAPCCAQDQPLIAGIEGLADALGMPPPTGVTVGELGVSYYWQPPPKGGVTSLRVGVHPSAEKAEALFTDSLKRRSGILVPDAPPPPDFGDQLLFPDSFDTPTTVVLRVRNAIVEWGWGGNREDLVALTHRVDQILRTDDEIAPKADQVPIPEVELSYPQMVGVGARITVTWRSPRAVLLRTYVDPSLKIEGEFEFLAREKGVRTETLWFASGCNVIFAHDVAFRGVPPEELPGAGQFDEWTIWRGSTVYFKRTESEGWSDIPHREREWFNIDPGTFAPLDDAGQWRQRARDELLRVLKPSWAPPMEMLEVAEDMGTPELRRVYHARFRREPRGMAILGVIGGGVTIYVQEPDTLPEGEEPLTPQDLLIDEALAPATDEEGKLVWPRLRVMAREFTRYRAFHAHEGPWEPVRVLLIEAGLPESVNLRFPGYE